MTRSEVKGWLRKQIRDAENMRKGMGDDEMHLYYTGMRDAYKQVAKKLEV